MKRFSFCLWLVAILSFRCLPAIHASSMNEVDIHGFISQGYLVTDGNNYLADTEDGTFEFNEMAINFATRVSPELQLGMQFFARDLGTLGNDNIQIDWAYGGYHWRDWLGVRAGLIKIPQCLYGETRDVDMLRTNVLLPQGVYNEGWRDTFKSMKGVGIYGEAPIPAMGGLSYQLLYGLVDPNPEDGQSKFLNSRISSEIFNYDTEYSYAADVKWSTPLDGLRMGVNSIGLKYVASAITNDDFLWRAFSVQEYLLATNPGLIAGMTADGGVPDRSVIDMLYPMAVSAGHNFVGATTEMSADVYALSVSLEFVWKNLIAAAEYTRTHTELEVAESVSGKTIVPKTKLEMEGFYGSVGYRFTDWLECGVYYSESYPDRDDKDGRKMAALNLQPRSNGWQKDWALSFRFDINENWVAKIEGHLMDGTAGLYAQDQKDPMNLERNWYLFASKLTYSF